MAHSTRQPARQEHLPAFYSSRDAQPCPYCRRPITWMYTHCGGQLPFDADLLPAELDLLGEGWLPGVFNINGRYRMVMAPVTQYTREKRRRVGHVATVHNCPYRAAVEVLSA
jgi:hypothetical protein